MSDSFRVGVLAPLFPPAVKGGGPIRSLDALDVTRPEGTEALIITADADLGSKTPLGVVADTWVQRGGSQVFYTSLGWGPYISSLRALRREHPDLLHFNSLFSVRSTIVPTVLWRLGYFGPIPALVSPRGELGAGALSRHSARKAIYKAFLRVTGTANALFWHSTSPHETIDIKKSFGKSETVVETEDSTLLPMEPLPTPAAREGEVRYLFVGRIVPHKGLLLVMHALQHAKREVVLVVAGTEQDQEYVTQCRRAAVELPENVKVEFLGAVPHEEVQDLLSGSDFLVLPTAGENFGHVIAEALAASVPVMTTPMTPWTELINGGGGYIISREQPDWDAAVASTSGLSDATLLENRESAGRAYKKWVDRDRPPHIWALAGELAGRKIATEGQSVKEPEVPLNVPAVQREALRVLEVLDQICSEHRLTYSLAYGSLLGATREGAPIPWDDDIDVVMPRPDYDRLLEIMGGKIVEETRLMTINEPDYPCYWAKLVSLRTRFIESETKFPSDYGVYVDVFPLDGFSSRMASLQLAVGRRLHQVFWAGYGYQGPGRYRTPRDVLKGGARLFGRLVPRSIYVRALGRLACAVDYASAKQVGYVFSTSGLSQEALTKDEASGTKRAPFGSIEVSVFSAGPAILEKQYGESWRNPIKRQAAFHGKAFWR